MTTPSTISVDSVVAAIEQELRVVNSTEVQPQSSQSSASSTDSVLQVQLRDLIGQQRRFREEPVGGRLSWLKRIGYWFVASAFDRQAKVVEGLLSTLSDAESVRLRLRDAEVAQPVALGRTYPVRQDIHADGEWDRPTASIDQALGANAEMATPEKLLLYTLVFCAKPSRVLEIGTFRGGSTQIMCAALEDSGIGRIICVDPEPRIPEETMRHLSLATILKGPSPDILPQAYEEAGGSFDFVLIDGDHGHAGVVRDIEGCLPYLADGALLIFHDSHYWEVAEAIDEVVHRLGSRLVDIGDLSTLGNPQAEPGLHGKPVVWGGLRLLRYIADPSRG